MRILDIFRWSVRLRLDPSHYFQPLHDGDRSGTYLSGIKVADDAAWSVPVWGSRVEGNSYRLGEARFLASELRRAGYNARIFPYAFVMLLLWLAAKKASLWGR